MGDAPRILIVKTGTTFPATRRRFGDYDRWFMDALRGAEAAFRVHDVTRSPLRGVEDHAGVIVTGSPSGVYENEPWMSDLAGFLRRLAERQRPPALCVCFGAQALAAALGGRVTVSPLGWEIGTVRVRLTDAAGSDPLLAAGPDRTAEAEGIAFQATHQDWIEALPGDVTVLAENDMSAFQAFRVGESLWGTQFHPEATPAILEDLLRARRAVLLGANGSAPYRSLLEGLEGSPAGPELLGRFVALAARR